MSIDELLARARARLTRSQPAEAAEAIAEGALLVDIRAESQRSCDGVVPDAVFIPRNVLEWRLDPASEWRDPRAGDPGRRVIVMCDEGYQSSLRRRRCRTSACRSRPISSAASRRGGPPACRSSPPSLPAPWTPRG